VIYVSAPPNQPLRQGDILYPVPMFDVPRIDSLVNMDDAGKILPIVWNKESCLQPIVMPVAIKPVWAIVCSQDCDASRAPVISCFLIDELKKVTTFDLNNKPVKSRINTIRQESRSNGKWFYLPPDESFGFIQPMAVRFDSVFQLNRESLIAKINELRQGRLCEVAYEHFRESIAQYFRRYPYNEWYPFSKEEFQEYRSNPNYTEAEPYPWQE
jgi:hypothetical protein